jgi:UDP-glucose 4-epimerase
MDGRGLTRSEGTGYAFYSLLRETVAHVLALRYLLADGDSVALKLGTGKRPFAAGSAANRGVRYRKNEIPQRREPRRAGHPASLVADPYRAQQVLGWSARRSMEEMVGST